MFHTGEDSIAEDAVVVPRNNADPWGAARVSVVGSRSTGAELDVSLCAIDPDGVVVHLSVLVLGGVAPGRVIAGTWGLVGVFAADIEEDRGRARLGKIRVSLGPVLERDVADLLQAAPEPPL